MALNEMFPKNIHLKIAMYLNGVIGVWPIVFEEDPSYKRLYRIYSTCIFAYYISVLSSSAVQLIVIVNARVIFLGELMGNISVTFIYTATLARVLVVNTSRVQFIIREMLRLEQRVFNSKDAVITNIYTSFVKRNHDYNKVFLVASVLVVSAYWMQPLFVEDREIFFPERNETVIVRPLLFSRWYPYSAQEHYLPTLVWQYMDIGFGSLFVIFSEIITFSFVTFAVGQLNIFIHIVSNMDKYALKVMREMNCSQEEAQYITMRECILIHKEIIMFVNELNSAFRNYMVVDFLQSSAQLASLAVDLVMNETTFMSIVRVLPFTFCMLMRLSVNYWHANEITHQSFSGIRTAVYETNWYDLPISVQKLALIMMLRCNRELCLQIGPFSTMTLDTFIGILKATYSYMMMIIQRRK